MTPVKIQAMEYGIPVYQPAKVREASFVEVLKGLEADVYVVIAFGQILPKAVLELPKYGCINIHASLLPQVQGRRTHPVVCHRRRKGDRHYHHDDGCGPGYR